ncbi:MAG: hypothetical protein HQK59_05595 [Deltaproteobacteria bacterium]|nr:hypothetical protein [Deltaproteobacteria bacterium]
MVRPLDPDTKDNELKIEEDIMDAEVMHQDDTIGKRGEDVLFAAVRIMLAALAAPVILIFLIKSPHPGQTLQILGVSYHQMVFVFLTGAALLSYVSLLFLGTGPAPVIPFFILSLYCCFPLIVGLKNNLTMLQVLTELRYFSAWPFFIRPGYILIEVLIPAGLAVYLGLQAKSIFSKQPHRYTFFLAAAYLGAASLVGFSALNHTGQPNITTAIFRTRQTAPDKKSQVAPSPSAPEINVPRENKTIPSEPVGPAGKNIPDESVRIKERAKIPSPTPPPVQHPTPAPTPPGDQPATEPKTQNADINQKLQQLTDQVNQLKTELNQTKKLLTPQPTGPAPSNTSNTSAGLKDNPPPASPAPPAADAAAGRQAIWGIQDELHLLSQKMDRLEDTLSRAETNKNKSGRTKKKGKKPLPNNSN